LQFKEVAEAYQVLSDANLRKRYDELGFEAAQAGPEGGFADPREIFRYIFGGEAFADIIGEISFVQLFAELNGDNAESASMAIDSQSWQGTRAERRRKMAENMKRDKEQRNKRIVLLAERLFKKINLYSEGNFTCEEFRVYATEDANRLKDESFGPELLQAIGYTYAIRARQHLGKDEFLGIPGVWHSMREGGHTVSNIVNLLKTAKKASDTNQKIQAISERNNTGAISESATTNRLDHTSPANPLDSEAAQLPPELIKTARTEIKDLLIQAVALDVQSVIGEVCDVVLCSTYPDGIKHSSAVVKKRAQALKWLGDIYERVGHAHQGTSDPLAVFL
jgi:curved DNA-binding protein CbpA